MKLDCLRKAKLRNGQQAPCGLVSRILVQLINFKTYREDLLEKIVAECDPSTLNPEYTPEEEELLEKFGFKWRDRERFADHVTDIIRSSVHKSRARKMTGVSRRQRFRFTCPLKRDDPFYADVMVILKVRIREIGPFDR